MATAARWLAWWAPSPAPKCRPACRRHVCCSHHTTCTTSCHSCLTMNLHERKSVSWPPVGPQNTTREIEGKKGKKRKGQFPPCRDGFPPRTVPNVFFTHNAAVHASPMAQGHPFLLYAVFLLNFSALSVQIGLPAGLAGAYCASSCNRPSRLLFYFPSV